MSNLIQTITLERGKHRLFESINSLLTVTTCVAKALLGTCGARTDWKVDPWRWAPGSLAAYDCRHLPKTLIVPLHGPIENAWHGIVPKTIKVGIQTTITPVHDGVGASASLQLIYNNVISPVFVAFYEDNVEWIRKNITSDVYKYPAPWDFARVIRNSMSHGGQLNIDNPNAPPVSWRGLTYGPADNKRQAVGTDLVFGDLVILMLEMSEALDRLGCPV